MRYRHPSDTEFRKYPLARVILEAVRYALYQPAHPDSKRQHRAKVRDLQLKQSRQIKNALKSETQP